MPLDLEAKGAKEIGAALNQDPTSLSGAFVPIRPFAGASAQLMCGKESLVA